MKDKIRALTRRTSQANPKDVLIRLNQIMHGWANYFRHAVAKHTFGMLKDFLWHRVITWLKTMHHWTWKDIQTAPRPPRVLAANHRGWDHVDQPLTDTGDHPVPLPRQHNPQPLGNHLRTTRRQQPWRARCPVMGTPGSASGLEKRTSGNTSTALQADSTEPMSAV